MSIKKCVNGSFVNDFYREYGTDTDTITSLPKTIIGDGQPISAYTIKGNMVQSGTPTPSNPIYPTECGDKTANLFDKSTITTNSYAALTGTQANSYYYCSDYIPIEEGAYYFKNVVGQSYQNSLVVYDANKNGLRYIKFTGQATTSGTTTFESGDAYIRINCSSSTDVDTVMVSKGSTALPYEPYGYKIPILSNGVSYPAYLGQVQSTRQIKKYEFTGNETFSVSNNAVFLCTISDATPVAMTTVADAICSHYEINTYYNIYRSISFGFAQRAGTSGNGFAFSIGDYTPDAEGTQNFKTWLTSEYANGTPVTVWYVLATPQTTTLNEPIRKIGDYSDSVTNPVTIPTSGTAQSFDVDTTLKPSEVSLTYHGWHEHSDEKYVGG